jgi:hypothetical protein
MLFAGNQYYPSGGTDDLVAMSDSIDELREKLEEYGKEWHGCDWWHIWDCEKEEEV